ncbi:hypothetical protein HPP92_018105 [Vanilla planifolia]|uniref:Uncharacterized protein n=1 Tax=Vanilla planifolia TaxID=51239 RepID=A0A835QJB1_VANPL|nr:hypothetical protein HPP92_018105 [Vanilla planifolia]
MAASPRLYYSCKTAAESAEWMKAITNFLLRFRFLIDAHVVNFFKDRLWETMDKQWMECLRNEPVENLLGIPSGLVQDHWPPSLQEFIFTLRSLVLCREQNLSHAILENFHAASLGSVLSQGMNFKKKHEVEILAGVINTIACSVNAQKIVDVGSGQGYLSQVLSFKYQLSVVAIDASSHHSAVTDARANRIKKHYLAKLHKLQNEYGSLKVPQTVTCQVLSSDSLAALSTGVLNHQEQSERIGSGSETNFPRISEADACGSATPDAKEIDRYLLVLAGLHACGDLSVNMLRTFVDCKQVKALVSVGCCYNLLSEEIVMERRLPCGFPMSYCGKFSGLNLGKNARDLACQSAERWKSLGKIAAVQNFDLHAFRAAFQMVLDKYYPEVITSSPSVGLGKAFASPADEKSNRDSVQDEMKCSSTARKLTDIEGTVEFHDFGVLNGSIRETAIQDPCLRVPALRKESKDDKCSTYSDKYLLFEEFSKSGLHRLGLEPLQHVDLLKIWTEAGPFFEYIGPFWSLRAALGPLIETYILLDRLLFLQEHGSSMEAYLLPIFDPTISPRNVAIIAQMWSAPPIRVDSFSPQNPRLVLDFSKKIPAPRGILVLVSSRKPGRARCGFDIKGNGALSGDTSHREAERVSAVLHLSEALKLSVVEEAAVAYVFMYWEKLITRKMVLCEDDKKQKALEAAMNDINSSFGKGSVTRLGSAGGALVETFPSGCLTLDLALGGGLPKGRIVEVFGPESSGKTTLALHAIAEVQKLGGNAMLVDAEHAFDPSYSRALGVDIENLIVCQPDHGEMALEIADRMCRSGAIDLICVDSVSALTPRAEIEGEIGMQQIGLQARLMSQALRKMSGNASKAGCTLIFLNQIRYKVGVFYGNPEVTSGGIALKFFASLRLEIRSIGKIKSGDEDIGVRVRVRVQKSKVSRPYKQAEFEIVFGEGVSKVGCVLDCAETMDIVAKRGSWYSYKEHRLGQGREKALQFLQENPIICAEIEKVVKSVMVDGSKHSNLIAYGQLSNIDDDDVNHDGR